MVMLIINLNDERTGGVKRLTFVKIHYLLIITCSSHFMFEGIARVYFISKEIARYVPCNLACRINHSCKMLRINEPSEITQSQFKRID